MGNACCCECFTEPEHLHRTRKHKHRQQQWTSHPSKPKGALPPPGKAVRGYDNPIMADKRSTKGRRNIEGTEMSPPRVHKTKRKQYDGGKGGDKHVSGYAGHHDSRSEHGEDSDTGGYVNHAMSIDSQDDHDTKPPIDSKIKRLAADGRTLSVATTVTLANRSEKGSTTVSTPAL